MKRTHSCWERGRLFAFLHKPCKTFSGLFYLPLHFSLAGFVLWSHSLLPESRQVFLQIPLILQSKPENTTSPKMRIPPHHLQEPRAPVTRVLILIVQLLEMRGRAAWWKPMEFTGICFKIILGQQLPGRLETDCTAKRMIQFFEVLALQDNGQNAVQLACFYTGAHSTRHSSCH